jgi:MFS family permease
MIVPGLRRGAPRHAVERREADDQIENTDVLLKGRRRQGRRRLSWPRVSRNVVLLGLTSLFTDVSSEMVATIVPLYLVYSLGLSPLQYGVVDGLHNGASAVLRLGGGLLGDRTRRHKDVAAVGYGASAFCKLGFLAAGSAWSALTAIVFLDRAGKGIRTAPRDTLISLSVDRRNLGAAFGVHRALDTAGAMIGPLVAFGLRLLAVRPLQLLVAVAGALALVTMSDGFLYLGLQRTLDFDARLLPLLYVGTAVVYMVLAVPMGRLADRHGRSRVFLGGYGLLLLAYGLLLLPSLGPAALGLFLLLFGAYYAATEGVLMALGSAILPPALRGSGLALIVTATSLARLAAPILFGAVWTFAGMETAVAVFAVALVGAAAQTALAALRGAAPQIVFEHVRRDDAYARIAIAPAASPRRRTVAGRLCERVYFAGGRGLCLARASGLGATGTRASRRRPTCWTCPTARSSPTSRPSR